LDLESSIIRLTARNPTNRQFGRIQQRRFTSDAVRYSSAVPILPDRLNLPHKDEDAREMGSRQKSLGSAELIEAVMDISDLTDENIDALMNEAPISKKLPKPFDDDRKEPKLEEKKARWSKTRNTEEDSSPTFKIRRPGARVEDETNELKIHYGSNPNWSLNTPPDPSKPRVFPTKPAPDPSKPRVFPTTPAPRSEDERAFKPPPPKENKNTTRPREPWQIQKAALKEKLGGEAWNPRKRLSPDAIEGIRVLHAQFPDQYKTETLASQFEVSPEAIRRILKSNWKPRPEEDEDRRERWFRRGEKIWERNAELGMKPPKVWRLAGVDRKGLDGDMPLWVRNKKGGGVAGMGKGGGIVIKKGIMAGDEGNDWDDVRGDDTPDWV